MGCVCGVVANLGKNRTTGKNIVAAILGALSYYVLYLGKSYLQQVALGSAPDAIKTVLMTKAITSFINAVIAVLVSVALYTLIAPALKRANLFQKETK